MPVHNDLRIGMLVLWHGMGMNDEDIDDVGIVVRMPGSAWAGTYDIAWSVENAVSEHSPEGIEEALYQRQLEIPG